MAKHGWFGSVAFAVGAGAGAAAAQFGLGYGFGVIAWSPAAGAATTSDNVWLSSLAWTLWIAANSTVVGAIAADRRSAGEIGAAPPRSALPGDPAEHPGVFATAIWRALLAVAASVGSLLSVALVLAPAHNAGRPDTTSPHLIAAGYAVVGVCVGIVLAVCALAARAAWANIVATGLWLWVLAATSVVVDAIQGRGYGTAALEVWPFGNSWYFRHTFSVGGAVLMLATAAIIGVGAAWSAIRRGDGRMGVLLSGGAGPLLVAAAYELTIPSLVGVADNPQVSASIVAPCAVLAGLAGSGLLLAAITGREASQRERQGRGDTGDSELDTVQLRKPPLIPAGVAATPGAAMAAAMATAPAKATSSAKAAPTFKAAPASKPAGSPVASASAKVPPARDAAETTTERIPTKPRRASDGAEDRTTGSQPTRSNPNPNGPNAGGKRGRRR